MRRLTLVIAIGAMLVLALAGAALAATPSEIYNDYAADGDLDGSYTRAELDAVLTDATLAQYANSDVLDDLKRLIRGGGTVRSSFPFTGFEAGIAAAVAALLVGGGVALRRSTR